VEDRGRSRSSRTVLGLRIAISVLVPATLIWLSVTGSLPSTGEIRSWGEDLGGAAPFLWPFIFAVAAILVPWPFVASATGLVFGAAGGTPLAVAGIGLVVCAQWAIGHWLAGEELRGWLVARIPRFEESLQRHGLLALVYSRITPGVPWGIVNYATGASGGRLVYLLIATLAGAPKIFAYVALGGSFDDLSSPEAIVAIVLLALTAIGGIVLTRRRIRAERASAPPA